MTLGFGVKSYVGYRIRQRKQREVAKENEFYMQLLQLALPSDDQMQDELITQIPQSTETLHSDELGDIVLPVSSPMAVQQLQQRQLALATSVASTKALATAAAAAATAAAAAAVAATNANTGNSHPTQHSIANSAKHSLNNSNSSILSNRTVNLSISTNMGNGHASSSAPASVIMNGTSGGGVHNNNNNSNNNTVAHIASTSGSVSGGVSLRANHRKSLDRSDRNNSGGEQSARANANNNSGNTKRTTYQGSVLRDASKMTQTISNSIWSSIKCRLFSGNGHRKSNDIHATQQAGSYATTSKRHDDDDADNDIDANHHQISSAQGSGTSRTANETHSGRSIKEMRNNNSDYGGTGFTFGAGAHTSVTTNSNQSSAKHDRDNSKTSNNNYSADIHNDAHYHSHNNHHNVGGNSKEKHLKQNGNVAPMEIEVITPPTHNHDTSGGESLEKNRGRRNRAKQKDAAIAAAAATQNYSKENHQVGANSGSAGGDGNTNTNSNSTTNHSNHHHSYVPEIKENGTGHTTVGHATSGAITMPQTCDSCHRLGAELKRIRGENSQLKELEADTRQKLDMNANIKNCLLAKQREYDELEKK